VQVLFSDAMGYSRHSAIQQEQAVHLMDLIDLRPGQRVLDAGCGDGKVTIDLVARFPGVAAHGIDVSLAMVQSARERVAALGLTGVTFEEANVLEFAADTPFDVVFANSSMHWVLPPDVGYGRLYAALVSGGVLATHQGGDGNYAGLWQCAFEAIDALALRPRFAGWSYPVYYPTPQELRDLLKAVGFVDVKVESREQDNADHPTLVRDFAHAGLLPFLRQVPPHERELFREEFLSRAERSRPSLHEHRLFARARRP
jgi:trans-aconitate methyltransferase